MGENFARNLELVDRIKEIAAEQDCTPGPARARLGPAPGRDVVPIPGTKRRRYLEENVAGRRADAQPGGPGAGSTRSRRWARRPATATRTCRRSGAEPRQDPRSGLAHLRASLYKVHMPRAIWSGAISFGLVNVPVKLYSATSPKTVRFHQLSRETGPASARSGSTPRTGDEVAFEDIVKGYEIAPGPLRADRARGARGARPQGDEDHRHRGVRRPRGHRSRSTTTTPTTWRRRPAAPRPTGCCSRRCGRPARWRSARS